MERTSRDASHLLFHASMKVLHSTCIIFAKTMHDMEKINEYRNTLAMPLCKLSIDKLVQEICLHPEYLKDIYQLISDDKIVVSWRAIWACEKISVSAGLMRAFKADFFSLLSWKWVCTGGWQSYIL